MAQAAQSEHVALERISFQGTFDAFRQWTAGLVQICGARNQRQRAKVVPSRTGRKEPRAVKKPSKYPPLNQPRYGQTKGAA